MHPAEFSKSPLPGVVMADVFATSRIQHWRRMEWRENRKAAFPTGCGLSPLKTFGYLLSQRKSYMIFFGTLATTSAGATFINACSRLVGSFAEI
jgi:hypothetical protein